MKKVFEEELIIVFVIRVTCVLSALSEFWACSGRQKCLIVILGLGLSHFWFSERLNVTGSLFTAAFSKFLTSLLNPIMKTRR